MSGSDLALGVAMMMVPIILAAVAVVFAVGCAAGYLIGWLF